jgi:hypothetical protein
MRMMLMAVLLVLVGCSGDEEAALEKRLKDHEDRIAALEEQLSRVDVRSSPKKSPNASSQPLPTAPRVEVIPAATDTGSPAVAFSPNSAPTEDQRLAIRALCSRKFGSDWQAVEKCEDEELDALERIAEGNKEKLPPEIYGAIRVQCAQQGRGEFTRQAACQDEQIEAYLRTQ